MNRRGLLRMLSALVAMGPALAQGKPEPASEVTLRRLLSLRPDDLECNLEETLRPACQAFLEKGEFEAIDKLCREVRRRRQTDNSGLWLLGKIYHAIKNIGERNCQDQVSVCERWLQRCPQSTSAQLSLAKALRSYAWELRGGGYADTVSKSSWPGFEKGLKRAHSLLESATQQPLRDCYMFVEWITVGMGLGFERKRVRSFFDSALAFGPTHSTQPYTFFARYLLPRWHGRPGDVESLANEAQSLNRDALGRGGYVLVMLEFASKEFRSDVNIDWSRCKPAFEDLVERFPRSRAFLESYLEFACYFKDSALLRDLWVRAREGKLGAGLSKSEWNSHFPATLERAY